MGFWDFIWGKPTTPVPAPNGDMELVVCENSLAAAKKERDNFAKQIVALDATITGLNGKILDLQLQLAQSPEVHHPKEEFWNSKYPKDETVRYTCRYIHLANGEVEACQVDPRVFIQPYGGDLKSITQSILASFRLKNHRDPTYDEWALECLQYVRKKIKYTSDKSVEGIDEYWQFWYETLELKTADCEDGAILMANLMLAAGIPYWRVRLNAGSVLGGGHAYVTYCRETDDEFVILDWCYWPNDLHPKDRKLHRDEEKYSGHSFDIWWSWNLHYCFRKATFLEDGGNPGQFRNVFRKATFIENPV